MCEWMYAWREPICWWDLIPEWQSTCVWMNENLWILSDQDYGSIPKTISEMTINSEDDWVNNNFDKNLHTTNSPLNLVFLLNSRFVTFWRLLSVPSLKFQSSLPSYFFPTTSYQVRFSSKFDTASFCLTKIVLYFSACTRVSDITQTFVATFTFYIFS